MNEIALYIVGAAVAAIVAAFYAAHSSRRHLRRVHEDEINVIETIADRHLRQIEASRSETVSALTERGARSTYAEIMSALQEIEQQRLSSGASDTGEGTIDDDQSAHSDRTRTDTDSSIHSPSAMNLWNYIDR